MIPFNAVASSQIGSQPETYHYELVHNDSSTLACISSDSSLRILDAATLNPVRTVADAHQEGITAIKQVSPNVVATAGRDGWAKFWDSRSGGNSPVCAWTNAALDERPPILSLAVNGASNVLAHGTELTAHSAEVTVWDTRSSTVQRRYLESHNDDVTDLQFHPTVPNYLLSGSTDGLINVFDLSVSDEDDALHQVINHGSSVHHAGFITETAIFGLSHDETLSMYQVANKEEDVEEPSPIVFGDIRPKLGCEYVINVLRRDETSGVGVIAAGNHSESQLDMYSLVPQPTWNLASEDIVRLHGAHGNEIVRCVLLDHERSTVFTCGEDGLVKAWRLV